MNKPFCGTCEHFGHKTVSDMMPEYSVERSWCWKMDREIIPDRANPKDCPDWCPKKEVSNE